MNFEKSVFPKSHRASKERGSLLKTPGKQSYKIINILGAFLVFQ